MQEQIDRLAPDRPQSCRKELGTELKRRLGFQFTMSGKKVLWGIIWFFVLILIAWPIGFFCAGWYVCLSPFEACIDGMKSLTALLMKGVTFPFNVTHHMIKGQSYSKI